MYPNAMQKSLEIIRDSKASNDWRRGVSPMRRFQDPVRQVSLDRYSLRGVSPLNRPEGRTQGTRGVSPLNRQNGNDFGQDSSPNGVMAWTSTPIDRSLMSETTYKVSVSDLIRPRQPLFKPPILNLGIKSSTNNQNTLTSKKETVKVPSASNDAGRKPLPSSSHVSISKKQTSCVKTVTPPHTEKAFLPFFFVEANLLFIVDVVDVSSMNLPEWISDISPLASSSTTSCSSSTSLNLNEENMMTKQSAVSNDKVVKVSTMNLPEWIYDISRWASTPTTSCSSSTSLDLNEENVMPKQTAASDDKTPPAKVPKKRVRFSQVAWPSDVDESVIKLKFSQPQARAFTIVYDEDQSELDRDSQPQLRPPPPPLVPYTGDVNRRLVPSMSRLSLEDVLLVNESRKRRKDMTSVPTGDVKKRKIAPSDGRNETSYVTRPKQWWLRKRRQARRKQYQPSSSSTSTSAVSATTSTITTISPGSASYSCPTSISGASSSRRRSLKRRAPDDDSCSGDGFKRSRLN
ncbi:uncharacterized protein [Haliotis asinina]|uniref:uncharacterized protein n=1 Tax=Haliotis asinina TaxID=109174 RepID=UPI003531ACFC